ncbi:MAG: DUF5668 domain-containing protein, partial [Acidobacteriota bacterium]
AVETGVPGVAPVARVLMGEPRRTRRDRYHALGDMTGGAMARTTSSQMGLGIMLLAVGGVLLVTRFVAIEAAPAWLLGLGAAFALLAILRRTMGALVAGMVMLGLGAGMLLGDLGTAGLREWTWIFLCLGTGFAAVYLLATLLKMHPPGWSLLVGGLLLAAGGARLVRQFHFLPPEVMVALRTWWPAALVLAGIWLLAKSLR